MCLLCEAFLPGRHIILNLPGILNTPVEPIWRTTTIGSGLSLQLNKLSHFVHHNIVGQC
jgi:hypothetical protein